MLFENAIPAKKNGNVKFYIFIFLATLILISYVSEQVYIIILQDKIVSIKNQKAQLDVEITNLKLDVVKLSQVGRIKQIAVDNFGMTVPEGAPVKLF
jgi:cell division protein FtsL